MSTDHHTISLDRPGQFVTLIWGFVAIWMKMTTFSLEASFRRTVAFLCAGGPDLLLPRVEGAVASVGIILIVLRLSPQGKPPPLTTEGCLSFAPSHEAFLRQTLLPARSLLRPTTLRSSRGKRRLRQRSHRNNRRRFWPRTSSVGLLVRFRIGALWKSAWTEGSLLCSGA